MFCLAQVMNNDIPNSSIRDTKMRVMRLYNRKDPALSYPVGPLPGNVRVKKLPQHTSLVYCLFSQI